MIATDNAIPAQMAQKDVTCTQLLPSQFYFLPLLIRSAAVKTMRLKGWSDRPFPNLCAKYNSI
jgi:hypothetical protein